MTIADSLRHLGLSAPDPRSDGELVGRFARTRDEGAFAELFRRHGPTVLGVCRRVLGDGPDADDAFQAVFLVLARKAGQIRVPGTVGNWLYGVAVRTAHKARVMNAKKVTRRRESPDGLDQHPAHTPGSPDRETQAVIDAELAVLPEHYRAAFVACELNGRSRSEAARDLGWPEGTVAARLAKARELLAARLSKRGVTLGVGLFAAVAVPAATATETLAAVRELLAVGTATTVTPAAQQLSDEVVKAMNLFSMRWVLAAGVLAVGLAAGGAALLAGPGDRPVREQIKAPVPKEIVSEWKEGKPIEWDGKRITGVTYSPDGAWIAVGADTEVALMDTESRKWRWSNPRCGPGTRVAFSPDGKTVAATFEDGVRLFKSEGGTIGTLEEKGSNPTAVAFFPDRPTPAKELQLHQIAFGHPGKLFVKTGVTWDKASTISSSLTPKGTAPEGVTALPLAVSPTGDRAVTLGPTDRKTNRSILWAWGAGGSAESKELSGHKGRPVAAAWSKEGDRIVTADEGGTLIVWDAETFKEKSRVEFGEPVAQLALAADGKTVAVVSYHDVTVGDPKRPAFAVQFDLRVFDVTTPPKEPKPVWTARKPFVGPTSVAFAPDGKTLLVVVADTFTAAPGEGEKPPPAKVVVFELVPKK